MAPRAEHPLTKRQQQCQKIARDKQMKKRMEWWSLRVKLIGLAIACVTVLGGGGWMWKSGALEAAYMRTANGMYTLTGRFGYKLDSVYLEGRGRTDMDDVQSALDAPHGTPILGLDLGEIRARLESLGTVKMAFVERDLPSTLHVRIIEREPVAIWQHQGRMRLIDDEGVVMTDLSVGDHRNLPLLIGEGAPKNTKEALAILNAAPELATLVKGMQRVGERRWNLVLKRGIEVRLPENNPTAAWKRLADMQKRDHLFERAVSAIDLRDSTRMIFSIAPSLMLDATLPSHET